MSTTLVGVFDHPRQAKDASRQLVAAGIDKGAIRLSGDDTAVDLHEARPRTEPAHEQGAISRFFSELFGMNHRDAANYTEAVQRGHVVLTVELVDDRRIDEICDVLEDCGAVDVDERINRWKVDGYQPPDGPTAEAQSGAARVHRRGHHQGTGGRDYVRIGEFDGHDVERRPLHGGSFGGGYGGVERRCSADNYSGVERRARRLD